MKEKEKKNVKNEKLKKNIIKRKRQRKTIGKRGKKKKRRKEKEKNEKKTKKRKTHFSNFQITEFCKIQHFMFWWRGRPFPSSLLSASPQLSPPPPPPQPPPRPKMRVSVGLSVPSSTPTLEMTIVKPQFFTHFTPLCLKPCFSTKLTDFYRIPVKPILVHTFQSILLQKLMIFNKS